jgi:DNA-binding winged helix-turn-helix (wHTH) protein
MSFGFGPFQLDEAGRVLRLADREIVLQPRVFDLLIYLVQHRERVVPKDELLDKLWPAVIVTEGSLQRAISILRAALREGGMEEAVRSFPRIGYRFCFDHGQPFEQPLSQSKDEREPIVAARRAVDGENWDKAAAFYKEADALTKLEAADLSRWALALYCLGRPSTSIPVLIRAAAAHSEAGTIDGAATAAATLSMIHMERGEVAVAKGWLSRATDLLDGRSDLPASGRLHWLQSRLAAFEGEPQKAVELAEMAFDIGRRIGDAEIEALGLMFRGFFKLSLGYTKSGLADQDHAAALSLSSKVHPLTGGMLYCNILWACRTFGDWARANQWTLGYQDFCTASRMEFSGYCQLHRAEVLGIRGSLRDALAHVEDSISRLSGDGPWALGDAHRVLGDVHSAIGNVEMAESAYEKAYSLGWDPEPGRALLLLERGDAEAAFASLERSLIGQSWWTLQRQGILLAHLALVAAHSGRHERAQDLINQLADQGERWPMPSIRALTNEAAAVLARRSGAPEEALRRLYLARQLWTSIESRLHAARVRLSICDLQLELGQKTSAMSELRVACAASKELGSEKLLRACHSLEARLQGEGVMKPSSEADLR